MSASFSIVEDVTIRGFRQGVGIHLRPRQPRKNSPAYYNQIRRCEITGCHRGILMQPVIGFMNPVAEEDQDERLPAIGHTGPNSTVITHCHIADFARAGIETWGRTTWVVTSTIEAGDPPGGVTAGGVEPAPDPNWRPCIVLTSPYCLVYRCRLANDRHHVVIAPMSKFAPDDEGSWLDFVRMGDYKSHGATVMHSTYFDARGEPSEPRLTTLEFPRRAGAVRPADVPEHEPYEVPAWDASGALDVMRGLTIDQSGARLSPQTTWTSDNLLRNTRFGLVTKRGEAGHWKAAPAEWQWREDFDGAPIAEEPRFREHDEPMFVGTVCEMTLANKGSATLEQRLVRPLPDRPDRDPDGVRRAWAQRSVIRGKRVVGGCWVWANFVGLVRVVFREGDLLRAGAWNWRAGEWVFVTSRLDPSSQDYPTRAAAKQFAVWFGIEVSTAGMRKRGGAIGEAPVVRFGAPQANLGPDLFPVGVRGVSACGGRVYGPVELAQGFQRTVAVSLAPEEGVRSTLFGSAAELDAVQVRAHPPVSGRAARYLAERVASGGEVRAILAFTVDVAGGVHEDVGFSAPVAVARGDRIRLRRLDGGPGAVQVSLNAVYSKVV